MALRLNLSPHGTTYLGEEKSEESVMGISRASGQPRILRSGRTSVGAIRCGRKFLRFFPKSFRDETYIDWERGYKAEAHERWQEMLAPNIRRQLLRAAQYA